MCLYNGLAMDLNESSRKYSRHYTDTNTIGTGIKGRKLIQTTVTFYKTVTASK